MVAAQHRITSGSDFTRTLKHGVRVPAHDLTLHLLVPPARWPDPEGRRSDVALSGGPRLGLIISRSVGNAVVRHRVARRLRAAFSELVDDIVSTDALVVVRARRGAAARSSTDLADQLREALDHRRVRRVLYQRDVELPGDLSRVRTAMG